MKILITGGSGLLGQYLNIRLSADNDILTIYKSQPRNCKNYNSAQIDINEFGKVEELFKSFSPEVAVHAAAVSNVLTADKTTPAQIYRTNVTATQNLARLCESYGTKLIYISTDLVYAGYRGSMLKEDAKIIPVSIYAETKLMGEVKVREATDNYLVLRTALMYGFGLNGTENHFHQMYNKLKGGEKVNLFSDQFRTPISLFEAARIIGELCGIELKGEVINLGGSERISRLELGYKLCEITGFDKDLIESVSMDALPDYPQVADVSMDTGRLRSFGIRQKSVEESLNEIINSN